MEKIVFDVDFLKSRGLTFGGKYLLYNSDLSDRAREMRKNLTLSEKKIWKLYLQDFNKRCPGKKCPWGEKIK